jgi:ribonuclease VapC
VLIDTSALVAILLKEADAPALVNAILMADRRLIAAPSVVEASAVMLARKGPGGDIALDALMERLDIEVLPMSEDASRLARLGYARFGKGVGSPAVLNYGDCLAYGVAMAAGDALLFKGEDFPQTDVMVAVY